MGMDTMKLGAKWERETMGQGQNATRIQRDRDTIGLEHHETGTKMGAKNNGTGTQCN